MLFDQEDDKDLKELDAILANAGLDNRCSSCAGRLDADGLCPQCGGVGTGIQLSGKAPQAPLAALQVHRILGRYIQKMGVSLSVGENAIDEISIMRPESILPVVTLDALRIWNDLGSQLGVLVEGQSDSLGVDIESNDAAYFLVSATPAPIGQDIGSTLRLLTYVLATRRVLGLHEGQHIDLLPLMRTWDEIRWDTPNGELPEVPLAAGYDRKIFFHEFNEPSTALTRKKDLPKLDETLLEISHLLKTPQRPAT